MQYHVSYDVDIVYFSLDDHISERERLYRLLSNDEKQRAQRYHFDKHRHRFISGRGKLREILAGKGKCKPEEIIFGLGEFGKPYIREPACLTSLQFNASSSGLIGAIAITHDLQLGFDIEQVKVEKGRDFDLIVQTEFTSEEFDWYWLHENSVKRQLAFYMLWTCKEAYLKALGIGLNGKLDSFSMNLLASNPVISFTELEPSNESALTLYQFEIADDVIACLALAKTDGEFNIISWENDRSSRTINKC